MFCLIVVAILNLTLQSCKLYGLLTSAWVSPINDGITRLEEGGGGEGEEGGVCVRKVCTCVCVMGV